MPLRAAASAVTWAAKGVLFREPLKPAEPAVSHAITLPSRSVSVTIVLLKDVLMWAWPTGTFFFARRRVRPRVAFCRAKSWLLVASGLLLALLADGLLRALAGTRVGLGALAVHRQAAPVAQAAVAADLGQALDVVGPLPPQVALDHELLLDHVPQACDLLLGEVADVRVRADVDLLEHGVRRRAADAVDVGEADLHPLLTGDVDACDAGHGLPPLLSVSPVSACAWGDRKSTRLNSSHVRISYAV